MIIILLTVFFAGYVIQYYITSLYLGNLPGNKFVNGIMFGVSEACSVILSGQMMKMMSDMSVFNIIFAFGIIAYIIYIFFGEIGNLCYLGIILLVQSLGGWQNIYFLVAELRVPPQSLGSVNMIAVNVALSLGLVCPYIAILPG